MTIFYFTATGNSLDAARKIGGADCTLLSIPQLMRQNCFTFKDDAVGLVCPVYYLGIPKMVTQFLTKAKWDADYSFAVLTYGGNQLATLYNLKKLVAEREQHFDYTNAIITVSNYIQGYDMAKAFSELSTKNVDKQIQDIFVDVKNRKTNTPAASLVRRAIWRIAHLAAKKFMHDNTAQKHYFVDEKCTKCGICAKVCPKDNITVADDVVFGDRCETCLACVHHCSQNALHIKGEKSAARYRNPDVSLKDIIVANGGDNDDVTLR
jgi:Pyruvate/2-oxoacid:ferredoxin oxidoreductase delta subunit